MGDHMGCTQNTHRPRPASVFRVRACVQVKGDNHAQTMDAIQHVVDKVVKRHKEGECRS